MSGDTWSTLARYDFEGNSYYDPLVYTSVTGVGTRHHLYDGLGSTRQLMAHADQSITDTYSYEAFGNLLGSTGSFPNPYRYVGSLGYYQTGSSLQHLGARYYLPEVGRLTRREPVRRQDGPSSYAYTGSSPARLVDPSGLDYVDTNVGAGAWIGLTGGVQYCAGSGRSYGYVGGGVISPGAGGALTGNPRLDPTPGFNCGVQGQGLGLAYQGGYGFGPGGGWFHEYGTGGPMGFSITCYYLWEMPDPNRDVPRRGGPCDPCMGRARELSGPAGDWLPKYMRKARDPWIWLGDLFRGMFP